MLGRHWYMMGRSSRPNHRHFTDHTLTRQSSIRSHTLTRHSLIPSHTLLSVSLASAAMKLGATKCGKKFTKITLYIWLVNHSVVILKCGKNQRRTKLPNFGLTNCSYKPNISLISSRAVLDFLDLTLDSLNSSWSTNLDIANLPFSYHVKLYGTSGRFVYSHKNI
jgi:hypothetical protein